MNRSQLPTYQFTKSGYEALKKEQEELLTRKRPEAVEELQKARELGDLSENGYYKAARAKLSSIDSRSRYLAIRLKYGKIIETRFDGSVNYGTRVTINDGISNREFEIVGKEESNPLEGKLSPESPIGRALMGKRSGDRVDIEIPVGKVTYTVLDVKQA